MTVVLSTAYFPPVPWFSVIAENENVLIEQNENFTKQTYRNRCEILSSNGKLALVVPLVKDHGKKTQVDKIKIDYSAPWQRIHLYAIRSAYGKTPFFIHYFDEVKEIIESGEETLWGLNKRTIEFFANTFGIKQPQPTTDFIKEYSAGCDLRNSISPKSKSNPNSRSVSHSEYFQAFSEKFGFVPGLSIIDLLFNVGPDVMEYLKKNKKAP
jgi:hypothetical protein